MKRFLTMIHILLGIVILTSINACREEFLPDFADVEILNNPPKVSSSFGDVQLTQGFKTYELDLNQYIFDPEGESITYTAVNSDDAVVTIELNGSLLKITEVGAGSSTVAITASDGNEGNVTYTEFKVIVEALGVTWFPMFDFPDGAAVDMSQIVLIYFEIAGDDEVNPHT